MNECGVLKPKTEPSEKDKNPNTFNGNFIYDLYIQFLRINNL